jgi:hypothetical protein
MDAQRASPRRVAPYLPFVLAAILAGCGGSTDSRSAAGVGVAANRLVATAAAGRYGEACEELTAAARASLAEERNGCAVALQFLYLALRGGVARWFKRVLPNIQVQGDTAIFRGEVQARYENGRWHLENSVW